MVNVFFDRYRIESRTATIAETNVTLSRVDGFAGNIYNESTELYELTGNHHTAVAPFSRDGTLYELGSDGINEGIFLIVYNYKKGTNSVNIRHIKREKQRGAFVNTITAGYNEYPENDIEGNYWYVITGLVETATLTFPLGAETISGQQSISWIKSSESVNVDIDYYNGNNWSRLADDQSGNSLLYDFSNKAEIKNAKMRIRANYLGYTGSFFTSGEFEIRHNYLPTIPDQLNIPPLFKNTTIEITWSESTDEDNDPITYYLERSINGGSFSVVLSGATSRSYTEQVDENWNTLRYRVRAYDGKDYGGYRTSTVRSVGWRSPSTPSNISVDRVKAGANTTITWTASSQADGNPITYQLQRKVGAGNFVNIANNINSRSYTDNILDGWIYVEYRVRAYDNFNYSSYISTGSLTVVYFPTLFIKTKNGIRQAERGAVKVEGQLKKISEIYIKQNGVIKEVE